MTTVPVFPNACNPQIVPGTLILRPWSRARGQPCQPLADATPKELDWRRKAEILKYKQRGTVKHKLNAINGLLPTKLIIAVKPTQPKT